MNLGRRVVEVLVDRFVATVGGVFSSHLDTFAELGRADQLDQLEERARQFEDEGKPQLAADLRARASQIIAKSPGAAGHTVICQLQHEQAHLETPLLSEPASTSEDSPTREETPKPAKRQPARRPSRRRPKAD